MNSVRDRLPELRAVLSTDEDDMCYGVEQKSKYIEEFFEEVELVRDNVDRMRLSIEELKRTHSAILSSPQTDPNLKQQKQDLLADIQISAKRISGRLKYMEREIQLLEQTSTLISDFKVRKTQHLMLCHIFGEVMIEYNKTQTDFREKNIELIKRQFEIKGRPITDEEIPKIIDSPNLNVFTHDIISDTQIAKQILADIKDRHEDIIKLEKSIKELNDLFVDLAFLVDYQGENIDRIEFCIKITKSKIEDAISVIPNPKDKLCNKRIRISACLIIMFIVLVIVIVVIFQD